MASRPVKAIHGTLRDDIGDLVTRRPLPGPGLDQIDPFLFLNHHGPQVYPPNNQGLPFGPHPHRGFETVTFILDGSLAHLDSGGHESVIEAGGVQWMTAGSGLVHAEISPDSFKQAGGPLEILQLWVNLPSRLKMTPPRYTGVQKADIPAIATSSGVLVHLISGEFAGRTGPIRSLTSVFMATVEMQAGAELAFDGLRGRGVFLYVARGGLKLDDRHANVFDLVELQDEGDAIRLCAAADSLVVFGHADPIREPVVAYGPFVMTSQAEIRQAIMDYQAGRFGGLKA
jgi:redox-sensitive bicupin YhaK (pirin superfamily)